jgi:hypothetical protein
MLIIMRKPSSNGNPNPLQLHKYQKSELSKKYCQGCNYAAQSAYEYDPIPPTCRPQGKGGVATIWHMELDPYIREIPDGNERILQILFVTGSSAQCLINWAC